jgi:hypothetical protein
MPKEERPKTGGILGGLMPSNSRQVQLTPGPDKSYDSIADYLYYIKAIQAGNEDAANQSLTHIAKVRGGQTASDLQMIGRRLPTTNLNDIAKRSIGLEGNPQIRMLYHLINENPDIINHFDMQGAARQNSVGLDRSLTGIK